MSPEARYTLRLALIVSLGGFLMGFDASVISGTVTFIEPEFALSKLELGWAVASLTLTATLAMMVAGPLSDRLGRRPLLRIAAVLFAVSAVLSALAPDFAWLVIARMLGGLGVGAALIVAPMYIAEMSPPELRGRMVSVNQLNIVVGISAAFFSNWLILELGQSHPEWLMSLTVESAWRWMLGVETAPAVIYFVALYAVPESPRWLAMNGQVAEARRILTRAGGVDRAEADLRALRSSIDNGDAGDKPRVRDLFRPAMRLVLTIGIAVAVLQQITGINAVFFYAPMIFSLSGIGADASFMQAVLVGLANLAFTVLAIALIDRIGRRPLLTLGLAGIALSMSMLAYGFGSATYTLTAHAVSSLPSAVQAGAWDGILGVTFGSDIAFREAVESAIGSGAWQTYKSAVVSAAISMNPQLILAGILLFVASFAVSIGPVMWVLFSELFPNTLRGLAISFVGLLNSAVSFVVQLVFPWELENIGNAATFLIYGVFAFGGLLLLRRILPETRGRTLEELERELVRRPAA